VPVSPFKVWRRSLARNPGLVPFVERRLNPAGELGVAAHQQSCTGRWCDGVIFHPPEGGRAAMTTNTAADHIAVIQDALAQIPASLIETIEIVVRADFAGATHEVIDFCREHRLRYSVGLELTEQVRAAILKLPRERVDRRARCRWQRA
jgi:hypothetical protein